MQKLKPSIEQTELVTTARIRETLLSVFAGANELLVIAGYTSASGIEILRPSIEACLRRKGTVTLLIGIDRAGVAGAETIRAIGRLHAQGAGDRLRTSVVVERAASFLHAKVYFSRNAEGDHLLVGSSNLTSSALGKNHEAVLYERGTLTQKRVALSAFLEGIPETQPINKANAEKVARVLEHRPGKTPTDPGVAQEHVKYMQGLLKALGKKKGGLVLPEGDTVLDLVHDFAGRGRFLNYDFDLDKLAIPAALTRFKGIGIIPAATTKAAGTSEMRQPSSTASFALLPKDLRKDYRKVALKLGKALNRFGIETPFGHWVPLPYVAKVEKAFADAAAEMPVISKNEKRIVKHVQGHREKLSKTITAIVRSVSKSIERPRDWKTRPRGELGKLWDMDVARHLTWGKASRAKVIQLLKEALRDDALRQLSPQLAVAKVRHLSPQLVPIDVQVSRDPESAAVFLACISWELAEFSLRKVRNKTRHAVRDLAATVTGIEKAGTTLAQLSELLQDSAQREQAMAVFFEMLAPLPKTMWTEGARVDSDGEEDDDALGARNKSPILQDREYVDA